MKDRTTATPRRADGVLLERSGVGAVIMSADGVTMLGVNDSAAALFELCDGETTVEEMVEAVCEVASISAEQARDDVVRALEQLAGSGLVSFE